MRCLVLGRCSVIAFLLHPSGGGPSLPRIPGPRHGCSDFPWAGVCRRGKQCRQPAAPGQVRCLVPGWEAQKALAKRTPTKELPQRPGEEGSVRQAANQVTQVPLQPVAVEMWPASVPEYLAVVAGALQKEEHVTAAWRPVLTAPLRH